jgi:hypothetical protein
VSGGAPEQTDGSARHDAATDEVVTDEVATDDSGSA